MAAKKQKKVKKNPTKDRINAAKDPNATPHMLLEALEDGDIRVCCAAAQNPSANEEVFLAALRSSEEKVRCLAAGNPSATPNVLLHALNDKAWGVRLAAASNPSATTEILFKALDEWEEDDDGVWYNGFTIAAVNNPNATPDILEKAVDIIYRNNDYEGFRAVLDSPKCTEEILIGVIGWYEHEIAIYALEKLKSRNIKLTIDKWVEIISSSECLKGDEEEIPSEVRKDPKYLLGRLAKSA